MKTLGIIAEYNPFHTGHAYQIAKARELSGCDKVIVVMSGNFVQRGEPSCMPTYLRTRSALQNGADMVVQLPVEYSTGSARDFARGGISILNSMGVDAISFGMETTDLNTVERIADILLNEPEAYSKELKAALKTGLSFPAAREKALISSGVLAGDDSISFDKKIDRGILGSSNDKLDEITAAVPKENSKKIDEEGVREILSNPNNILGLEYIMAIRESKSKMEIYPVKRLGQDYHDARLNKNLGFNSATALRETMALGSVLWLEFTPFNMQYYYMMSMNKALPLFPNDFSLLLHDSLLKCSREQLMTIADVDEALADRIIKLRDQFINFDQFVGLIKNKAYTYSRISRVLIHILLEIKKDSYKEPSYIRVLGVRNDSEELIGYFTKKSSIPIITSINASTEGYARETLESIELNNRCDQIYNSVICNKFKVPYRNENKQFFMKI